MLIVAGPNGSGKTTVTRQLLAHKWFDGCEYLNPDEIAEAKYGGWNSPDAVKRAADEVTTTRADALRDHRELAFETVFSTAEKLEYLLAAKSAGYFVRLFFVATAGPEINAARIARRILEGGHEVPLGKIVARYEKSIQNCAAVATDVDRLYVFDNSVEDAPVKLVLKAKDGVLAKQYADVLPWMDPIIAALAT